MTDQLGEPVRLKHRWLAVATAVLNPTVSTADVEGWRIVREDDLVDRTRYARRSLRLAWQDLADIGAAEIGRLDRDGTRRIRPGSHPVWVAGGALVACGVEVVA